MDRMSGDSSKTSEPTEEPKRTESPSEKGVAWEDAVEKWRLMHAAQERQRDLERKKVPKRPRLEWLREHVSCGGLATVVAALIVCLGTLAGIWYKNQLDVQRIATAEARTQTAEARLMRTEEASQTAATGTAQARAQVTATPATPATPGETVRLFFEFLNHEEYSDAWELLDPDTRGDSSDYAGWVEFWRAQGLVEVRDTKTLEVTFHMATVFAHLRFESEQRKVRTYNVRLVFDSHLGRWLITSLEEDHA